MPMFCIKELVLCHGLVSTRVSYVSCSNTFQPRWLYPSCWQPTVAGLKGQGRYRNVRKEFALDSSEPLKESHPRHPGLKITFLNKNITERGVEMESIFSFPLWIELQGIIFYEVNVNALEKWGVGQFSSNITTLSSVIVGLQVMHDSKRHSEWHSHNSCIKKKLTGSIEIKTYWNKSKQLITEP